MLDSVVDALRRDSNRKFVFAEQVSLLIDYIIRFSIIKLYSITIFLVQNDFVTN